MITLIVSRAASGVLFGYVLLGLAAQVIPTDPISGHAGWVGAGLLGSVLGWLLFIHLPAKDKQLKEFVELKDAQMRTLVEANTNERDKLVERYDAEREKERDARHKRAGEFQVMINQTSTLFQQTLKSIEETHRADAEKDRAAFMERNNRVEDAIRLQTTEIKIALQAALSGACRYALPRLPERQDPTGEHGGR